jgi:hypothetical protein
MAEHEGTMTQPPPDTTADRHGWVELEAFASMFGYGRRWALGEYEAGRLQCRYIGRRLVTRQEWVAQWSAERAAVEDDERAQ